MPFTPSLASEDKPYLVPLDHKEGETLIWLGARYYCAEMLCEYMEREGEGWVISLPEWEGPSYLEALVDENGNPAQTIPPCAGGTLADKLLTLWEGIL